MAEFGRFHFPEQGSREVPRGMVGRGGSRFGIQLGERRPGTSGATTTREAPPSPITKEKEAPDSNAQPPTKEEIHAFNDPHYRAPALVRLAVDFTKRNPLLVVGGGSMAVSLAVGGALLAPKIIEALQNNDQGVHEQMPSSEVYDSSIILKKGKVSTNDIQTRSLEEIAQNLNPSNGRKDGKTVRMTWGFDFADGETIKYERPQSPWQPTKELQAQVDEQGIKPEIIFTLNKGNIFRAPLFIYNDELPTEYRGMLMRNSPDLGAKDTSMTGNGRLFLYYEKSNISIVLWFFGDALNEEDGNYIPLMPMQGNSRWDGLRWRENFSEIKPNDPILKAAKNGQRLKFTLKAYNGEYIEKDTRINPPSLVTPIFEPGENAAIIRLSSK